MQTCEKCVVRNADILSLQDTLLWSGHVYADNCLIVGNVDYIWGTVGTIDGDCVSLDRSPPEGFRPP